MVLGIDPYVAGWLDLIFRWFHVTAAIVWIGTSFYFVALDQHLHEPRPVDLGRCPVVSAGGVPRGDAALGLAPGLSGARPLCHGRRLS